MIDFSYKRLLGQTWHPSPEDLFLFLDGGTGHCADARIRAHLRTCWACRAQREKIEHLISAFMEEQKFLGSESPSFPEVAIPKFEAKLKRLASQRSRPLRNSHLSSGLESALFHPRLSLGVLCSFILLSAAVLLIGRLVSVKPVSAMEVLQRTEEAEFRKARLVSQPVVHQKIRVRRHSPKSQPEEVVTWEIWKDASNSRFSQRVEDVHGARFLPEDLDESQHLGNDSDSASRVVPQILADLGAVYLANRWDQQQPLSARAYQKWRESVHLQSERVTDAHSKDGEKVLRIETLAAGPYAPNSIISAEMIVRAEDWHPVQEHLYVQGENETHGFELVETSFEVLALNALSRSIFSEPAAPIPQAILPPTLILARSSLPSSGELTAAEIEAHYALHRLQACLGEPIEVVRGAEKIEVHGYSETAQRKEELIAALQKIPLVTLNLQTTAQAFAAASSSPSSQDRENQTVPSVQHNAVVEVQSSKLPVQDLVEQYFAEGRGGTVPGQGRDGKQAASPHQQISELSHEVVSASESALDEAWALRHLAELGPSLQRSKVHISALWLLEQMIRDHLDAVRTKLDQTRALVEPVLSPFVSSERHESGNAGEASLLSDTYDSAERNWAAGSLRLFAAVDQTVRLTLELFADGSPSAGHRDEAIKRLLSGFDHLEKELQNVDARVAQDFSNSKDLPSSVSRTKEPTQPIQRSKGNEEPPSQR